MAQKKVDIPSKFLIVPTIHIQKNHLHVDADDDEAHWLLGLLGFQLSGGTEQPALAPVPWMVVLRHNDVPDGEIS